MVIVPFRVFIYLSTQYIIKYEDDVNDIVVCFLEADF